MHWDEGGRGEGGGEFREEVANDAPLGTKPRQSAEQTENRCTFFTHLHHILHLSCRNNMEPLLHCAFSQTFLQPLALASLARCMHGAPSQRRMRSINLFFYIRVCVSVCVLSVEEKAWLCLRYVSLTLQNFFALI